MIQGVVKDIFENVHSLSIDFPLLVPPTKKPHVYFALDISGSMSGGKLKLAKESITLMIDVFEKEEISFTLIAFSDSVVFQDTREIGFDAMRKFVDSLGPSGGTRFINVFVSLKEQIEKNNDSSTGILWLTDGCDNDGISILEPCMDGFKKWILDKQLLTAIHAIGLGDDHDAVLLMKLIKFGTHEGTFQFCADSEEIVDAVQRLKDLLFVSGGWGYVKAGANKYKISLPYDKIEKSLTGSVFVNDEDLKSPLTLELSLGGEKKEYIITPVGSKDKITPKLFNAFAREQLRMVIEALHKGGINPDQKAAFVKLIMAISGQAAAMAKELQTQSEAIQKAMLPFCTTLIPVCTELSAMILTSAHQVIGNRAIAKLNDLLFQGILGGRMARKVEKLLVQGEAFTKACKIVEKYGFKELLPHERELTQAQFEIRVGPKHPGKGIKATVEIFGKGKELTLLYNQYAAPLMLDPETPFGVVSFIKKRPAALKETVKELVEGAWNMGAALTPAADYIHNLIERKYGDTESKVYCLVCHSPAGKIEVGPFIEKLKGQAALKVEDQGAQLYFELVTNLEELATSSRPFYQILLDGGKLGWKSSLLEKLGDIPGMFLKKIDPKFQEMWGIARNFVLAKKIDGELVFEINEGLRSKIDAFLGGSPLGIPLKENKAAFGPMVMGMVEQIPILKSTYEFFKSEVEGIEFSFYGAGLFGGSIQFQLPGLGALLNFDN